MRKYNILLICLVIIGIMVIGSGCSSSSSSSSSAATTTTGAGATITEANAQKTFTAAELSKYNGQNGNPAYVAVSGVVYDVTNAKGWSNGTHKNGVTAGKDLTKEINSAPHGLSVLSGLPVVGTYKG